MTVGWAAGFITIWTTTVNDAGHWNGRSAYGKVYTAIYCPENECRVNDDHIRIHGKTIRNTMSPNAA